MTFLETFLIPFATSIFANFSTDKIKDIFTNNSIEKYEKSFTKAMIATIENSTEYAIFNDDIMKRLVKKIKEDNDILLITVNEFALSGDNNFLNLIEEEKYDKFWKSLLINYSILHVNDKNKDIYRVNLGQFLINFKYEFFKLVFDNQDTLAIYMEVLKIDNIMDILKKINLKTEEFNDIKNLFLQEHIKINAVYKKNRKDYDEYIERKYEFLELAGFSPKISGKDIFMKLSEIFIPLSIDKNNNELHNSSKKESIENILNEKALVILGDPGSGKSTLLRYIASFIASNRKIDWEYKEIIPIFVKVSEYADWYQTYKKGLFDYIIEHDSQYSNLIKENIEYSNLLILLDGLDEITNSAIRNQVVKQIVDIKSRYPHNNYIVTSRLIGYRETTLSGHFIESKLLDFNEKDIKTFAKNWYHSIADNYVQNIDNISDEEKKETYSKYINMAEELFDSISRNPSVIKFAKNPLLMTIVAMIFYQSKKLPNKRVELYDIATETFLDNWVRVRFQEDSTFKDKGTVLEILPHIAFNIHENSSKGLISENDFKKEFINIYEDINGETANSKEAKIEFSSFKDFLEKYTGFFYRKDIEGSLYGFVHLTFEEYLSALELKSKWDLDDLNLENYIFDSRWIEVVRLAVANIKISNKGKSGRVKATQFIEQILDIDDKFSEAYGTLQMSLLILVDDIEIDNEVKKKILKGFMLAIGACEDNILLKSFAKLISELLFSIYKDDLIVFVKDEILQNNEKYIKNITQILIIVNNSETNSILSDLFFNKESSEIAFVGLIDSYYYLREKENSFLKSKKFFNKFKIFIIENNDKENIYFGIYMKLYGFSIFGHKEADKISQLFDMFNKEKNAVMKDKYYYFIAAGCLSSRKEYVTYFQNIEDERYRGKLERISDLFNKYDIYSGGRENSYYEKYILHKNMHKQDNNKLIYDLEEVRVYNIKKTTQIKHSQFKGLNSSKKDILKTHIKFLQGNECCSKKVDYFLYVYNKKKILFNFFEWERFLIKNFLEKPEELSIILLENIQVYEKYEDGSNSTYLENIVSNIYFNQLIAPVQLFFLKQIGKPYNQDLIDESLLYYRETKNEKLKKGIYYLLYGILTPY